MNRQVLCSAITSVFITAGVIAQSTSKTFKETFNVGESTVLNIDTSNTDIEFETWNKNEVEIIATIELDGASKEEAERYFKSKGIEIKGNSREIDVFTGKENQLFFNDSTASWSKLNTHPIVTDLSFPDLPELVVIPDLPPIPNINFDYEAYQKDGEKYLKEWKKQFDKGFDEEFKKNFEAWGKEFEKLNEERTRLLDEHANLRAENLKMKSQERKIAYEKRRAKLLAEREKKHLSRVKRKYVKILDSMEEQKFAYDERRAALNERRNERRETMNLRRQELRSLLDSLRSQRREVLFPKRDSLRFLLGDSLRGSGPNVFHLSREGHNKRYKVKKTIKIKLPKAVKLKMNVRHGEVKLAETTNNMQASIAYVSLIASTIDGNATNIRASYSPVQVQKWNYGQLKTNYSDKVSLKEVGELKLNSTSSNVVIDRLNKSVLLSNNLGVVHINSVSNNFKDIDVSVQNGEFSCKIPKTPVSFYLNGTKSKLEYPPEWTMERTKNFDNVVYKGFQTNHNSGKSIRVNSKYSEVVLEN